MTLIDMHLWGISDQTIERQLKREAFQRYRRTRKWLTVLMEIAVSLVILSTVMSTAAMLGLGRRSLELPFLVGVAAAGIWFGLVQRKHYQTQLQNVLRRCHRCPSCGYQLTPATKFRCPECGEVDDEPLE